MLLVEEELIPTGTYPRKNTSQLFANRCVCMQVCVCANVCKIIQWLVYFTQPDPSHFPILVYHYRLSLSLSQSLHLSIQSMAVRLNNDIGFCGIFMGSIAPFLMYSAQLNCRGVCRSWSRWISPPAAKRQTSVYHPRSFPCFTVNCFCLGGRSTNTILVARRD